MCLKKEKETSKKSWQSITLGTDCGTLRFCYRPVSVYHASVETQSFLVPECLSVELCHIILFVTLFCVVLCCVMLCYVMFMLCLCYVMLCHVS